MKKILISTIALALVGGFLGGSYASAQGLTVEELQEMVTALQAQIDQLLQQIQNIETGKAESAFCFEFENSLRQGNQGDDVTALQTALTEDGVYTGPVTGYFGPLTREAVVKFQEKYREEILAPFDIVQGTGFVGATTRAKLNKLFECKENEVVISIEEPVESPPEPDNQAGGEPPEEEIVEEVDLTPSLVLVSPNGGETWDIGKEYEITWGSENVSEIEIQLYKSSQLNQMLASSVTAESGSYVWTIPKGSQAASDYTVRITDKSNGVLFDESDASFRTAIDTLAPVLSNGSPTGTIAAGTASATLSFETNERAVCRYSTKLVKDYYSMIDTFAQTNAKLHQTIVSGLRNGNTYAYYVKCLDVAGNRNFTDFKIDFQVGQ